MNNHDDWLQIWRDLKNPPFHESQGNPLLQKYLPKLALKRNDHCFVPLCGKSCDLVYLAKHYKQVSGYELSQDAIELFFKENQLTPEITLLNNGHKRYQANNISLICGDIFELKSSPLVKADLIYDRAALVALPQNLHLAYLNILTSQLANNGQLLLLTMQFDRKLDNKPPYSLTAPDIKQLAANCQLKSKQLHQQSHSLTEQDSLFHRGVQTLTYHVHQLFF